MLPGQACYKMKDKLYADTSMSEIAQKRFFRRVVSHIPKFGDASKFLSGDTASTAGDATSLSGDAIVSHWRCIISFRDAHPPHLHPHLP